MCVDLEGYKRGRSVSPLLLSLETRIMDVERCRSALIGTLVAPSSSSAVVLDYPSALSIQ